MKSSLIALLFSLFFSFSSSLQANESSKNTKPFVIPEITNWKGAKGTFSLNEQSKIVYPKGDVEIREIAQVFAADYATMFDKEIPVISGKGKSGDIVFRRTSNKKLGNEGYSIKIANKVVITASTAKASFWATRTLLQMSEQDAAQQLPKGSIYDQPDFALRGFMIDAGRKYIPMSYLRKLVKVMGYYKMNTLQVHLNDNGFKAHFGNDWKKTYAAFRLECDTYPGLTARDGSYTKKEFIAFQKLANQYGVEIIPEIDAPAHALAFTHYKPELGSVKYGVDHLDLYNPATYEFMDGLWKEYIGGEHPVFIGKRVHIGTDEYKRADAPTKEKFRAFADRYIKYVESFGKQACLWGSLKECNGETPVKSDNVIMSMWYNGYADPREMIKDGFQAISIPDGLTYIVPAAGYYYDYLNCKYLYQKWTPNVIGKEVFDYTEPAILGGMFAVWNDCVGNGISVKDIHHRVYPALQTLSTKMWTGSRTKIPFEIFDVRRLALSEAPGVNELGRIGTNESLVLHQPALKPQSKLPYEEIGYDYTVQFRIKGGEETKGTVLLEAENSVFYLSDPVKGMLGYSREGCLYTFPYRILPGEEADVCIQGNNKMTRLLINGKLIEQKDIYRRYFTKDGKQGMNYVSTLVFPLKKAGCFKSKITNFKVYNYILEIK